MLPIHITFGDEEFQDGVTLTHKMFYEKLVESDELPITSQVPPFAFEEAYRKAKEQGDRAIVPGKARGSRQGNNLLAEQIRQVGGIGFGKPFVLGYTGLSDAVLQKYIVGNEALWAGRVDALATASVGGAIGTHIGPGAIGAAFFSMD